MEKFMLIIIVLAVLYYGWLLYKGAHFTANEQEFRQAGVRISFVNKTITIKGKTYRVDQVTGIRWEALTHSHKHGSSIAKSVIIDLDDFKRPHHKITLLTRGHAQKLSQRLCTALRKAGGPSFV